MRDQYEVEILEHTEKSVNNWAKKYIVPVLFTPKYVDIQETMVMVNAVITLFDHNVFEVEMNVARWASEFQSMESILEQIDSNVFKNMNILLSQSFPQPIYPV